MIQLHTAQPKRVTYQIPRSLLLAGATNLFQRFLSSHSNRLQRAALKPLIAFALGWVEEAIEKSQVDYPLPDQRCADAKADFLNYGLTYLLNFTLTIAEAYPWQVEGVVEEREDGTIVVVSGISTPLTVAEASSERPPNAA